MKLALIQCDVINGNMAVNAAKLILFCQQASEQGAQLCICPAQALAGPDVACLPLQPDYGSAAAEALSSMAMALRDGPALFCQAPELGFFLIANGAVTPCERLFEYGNVRFGVDAGPTAGVDINLELAGRPFIARMQSDWEMILSGLSIQANAWTLAVNLTGGYGSDIYNGQSVATAPDGSLYGRAKAFEEDVLLVDTAQAGPGRIEPLQPSLQASQWNALRLGLADFVAKAGASRVLLGLSGGMDSALVACIATDALGAANVTGLIMPSQYTSDQSIRDASAVAENLGIQAMLMPIESIMEEFQQTLAGAFTVTSAVPGNMTEENLQARIRGVLLMALANRTGALVLNTGNKSESAMGYSTLYGDSIGAVAVIGDLYKTQVYELAAWRNAQGPVIPQSIFEKAPSAELRPNQKDTDSLPPYEELDPDLDKVLRHMPLLAEDARLAALRDRVMANRFKRRQSPPPLIVSGTPLDGCNHPASMV